MQTNIFQFQEKFKFNFRIKKKRDTYKYIYIYIYIHIAELQSELNASFKVDLLDSRFATLEKIMVWTI